MEPTAEGTEIVPTLIIASNVLELRDRDGELWARQGKDRLGDDLWYMPDRPHIRNWYTEQLIEYCPLKVVKVA